MENLATIAAIAGGALYFLTRKKADTATSTDTPAQSTVAVGTQVTAVKPVTAAPRIVLQTDLDGPMTGSLVADVGLSDPVVFVVIDGESRALGANHFRSLHPLQRSDTTGWVPQPSAALMTADLDALVATHGIDAAVMMLRGGSLSPAELQARVAQRDQWNAMVAQRIQRVQPPGYPQPPGHPTLVAYQPTGLAPATQPTLRLSATSFVPVTQVKTYTVPTVQTVQTSPKTTYSTAPVQTVYSAPSLAYTPTKTATTSTLSIKPTTTTNLTYKVG